ncbi:MAG: outer membrane beta-barrel protein [Burkholderiales bacterium]|nr:outer membrane beta-barrel protein [Burkholderiales bacterium]
MRYFIFSSLEDYMKLALSLITTAVALTFAVGVQAQESQWAVKGGIAAVIPKSNNGTLVGDTYKLDVGTSVRPSIVLEYFITPNLSAEVLGAWPFRSDLKLNGAKAAKVDYLPPTVSLNWHFLPGNTFDPYLGLGLNYTFFYSEKERNNALAGAKLDVKNTFGVALHGGVEFNIDKNWFVNADLRWISIRPKVKLDGGDIGKAKIDPWVIGLQAGYRF